MDNFYGQFGAQLNALGFAVAGIDWPGHGQSEGTRCHTTNFDEFPQLMLNFADSIVIPRLRKFLHTESSEGKRLLTGFPCGNFTIRFVMRVQQSLFMSQYRSSLTGTSEYIS